VSSVEFRLELIVVPVTDVDRAKAFYSEKAGFTVDVDHSAGEDFRVVQLTPTGSACSIALMKNPDVAGHMPGLQMVVNDLDAAQSELRDRGVEVSDMFHFGAGGRQPGPDPTRADFASFFSFEDPDGNHWLVQEAGRK